ncbi:inositol polyphosphate 1-phosphatase isoform X2 [Homalodisca vitripennis]|uniref:inositol polyphosphate 1-phosphatase isoform X2 n=1 Tax=Homalodisca vitripennis TaxID=197043 RepID=UPI001EEACA32|nr:inositol polyphosphate 1-phosphatase isoform X2 [Homalodisca vitripennis]
MSTGHFLRSVILVSEKAAKIARAIRQEEHLLSLLVREKKEDEKNQRFAHDFKTLADVLVQEVVKHDLGSEFPDLVGHICGEESNEFSCLDGETICLTVGGTEEETYNQLVRILGNERAACTLAHLVHSTAEVDLVIPSCSLSTDELAIWIDPIDATAEYITGGSVEGEVAGMFRTGLPCVTVLIGAFHRLSGTPVLGVINQPFCQQFSDRWEGKILWGFGRENNLTSHILEPSLPQTNKLVVLSCSESAEVKSRLTAGGFKLIEAAGAGYKLLCVALRLVSAYVLSKPSTYYWDTCGIQAVLLAMGGGVVSYSDALRGEIIPLAYQKGKGTEQCCNESGLIAYSDRAVLEEIVMLLK